MFMPCYIISNNILNGLVAWSSKVVLLIRGSGVNSVDV